MCFFPFLNVWLLHGSKQGYNMCDVVCVHKCVMTHNLLQIFPKKTCTKWQHMLIYQISKKNEMHKIYSCWMVYTSYISMKRKHTHTHTHTHTHIYICFRHKITLLSNQLKKFFIIIWIFIRLSKIHDES